MNRLTLFIFTPLAFFFWTLPVLGYGPCDEDAAKLCQSNLHHETEKNCLHLRVEELSAECKSFVKSKEPEWKAVTASWSKVNGACTQEIEDLCRKTKSTEMSALKATQVCLMMEPEKLSNLCKSELNRHIKLFQPSIRPLDETAATGTAE